MFVTVWTRVQGAGCLMAVPLLLLTLALAALGVFLVAAALVTMFV